MEAAARLEVRPSDRVVRAAETWLIGDADGLLHRPPFHTLEG